MFKARLKIRFDTHTISFFLVALFNNRTDERHNTTPINDRSSVQSVGTLIYAIWNSKRVSGDATSVECRLRNIFSEGLYAIPKSLYYTK